MKAGNAHLAFVKGRLQKRKQVTFPLTAILILGNVFVKMSFKCSLQV